jgi:hypothetical protein
MIQNSLKSQKVLYHSPDMFYICSSESTLRVELWKALTTDIRLGLTFQHGLRVEQLVGASLG